jgi:hypothetical protein
MPCYPGKTDAAVTQWVPVDLSQPESSRVCFSKQHYATRNYPGMSRGVLDVTGQKHEELQSAAPVIGSSSNA